MTFRQLLGPVAAVAVATGCFASKGDIALLQDEIRTMRAMEARALMELGRYDHALELLGNDASSAARDVRAEIF